MRLIPKLVDWLRQQVEGAGARGAVFGLSGGVDSAVVGALCRQAFNTGCLGVIMPCHSAAVDTADAQLVAAAYDIPTRIVDLTPVYDVMLAALGERVEAIPAHNPGTEYDSSTMSRVNLKPRLRMTALYHYANAYNYLVVGSENRSELEIGYFTKYGDGGVDLLPLGRLLKTDVYAVAQQLDMPTRILERIPSAGLWQGQTDEDELGISYDVLDNYLATGVAPSQAAQRIEQLRVQSGHKRRLPPMGPGLDQSSTT